MQLLQVMVESISQEQESLGQHFQLHNLDQFQELQMVEKIVLVDFQFQEYFHQ